MMKLYVSFMLAISLAAIPLAAKADRAGGGGNAVVCEENGVSTTSLLDFYEGRILNSLNIQASNDILEDVQLHQVNQKVADATLDLSRRNQELNFDIGGFPAFGLDYNLADLKTHIRFLPPGITLPALDDSKVLFNLPATCHYERLAYYEGEKLYIVTDVWNKLTSTDKAGLYAHEIIYKYLRTNGPEGDTDSRRARSIVAYLFSDSVLENIFKGVPKDSYVCETTEVGNDPLNMKPISITVFALYKNGKKDQPYPVDGYTIQFLYFLDRPVLSKKTLDTFLTDYQLKLFSENPVGGDVGGWAFSNESKSLFQGGDTIAFSHDDMTKPNKDLFLSIRSGDQPVIETRLKKVQCRPWKRF